MTQGASGHENYAHWLIDIIPKIKMIDSKYPMRKIDYYYFTKINKVQKQSLKILGINSNNFINSDVYRHIKADKLLAVTHLITLKIPLVMHNQSYQNGLLIMLKRHLLLKKNKKKFTLIKFLLIEMTLNIIIVNLLIITKLLNFLKRKNLKF